MADVFISYSHSDHAFALRFIEALDQRHYTSWLDENDTFPAGEFREDIKAGIEEAGAFIFILSPDSLISDVCGEELRYAQECGKKLIPLHYRRITPAPAPPALRGLSWIPVLPLAESSEGDAAFDRMLEKVLIALQADRSTWQKTGQWLRLATCWDEARTRLSTVPLRFNSGTNSTGMMGFLTTYCMSALRKLREQREAIALRRSLLLRGKELREAEGWLKEAERWRLEGSKKKPQPLSLHIQFIRESRRAAQHVFFALIMAILLLIGFTGGGAFLLLRPPDPTLVTTTQEDGTGSLRWAIANALPNQSISFAPQVRGTIILKKELTVNKPLTVRGPGEKILALKSLGPYGLHILPGVSAVSFSGFSFTNGNFSPAASGGFVVRVDSTSSLRLDHVTIAKNQRGGISSQGKVMISNSTIADNIGSTPSAPTGPDIGGIVNDSGTMTVSASIISGNSALVTGGIRNSSGTTTISDSIISGNFGAYYSAGGIWNASGTMTITHSMVSGNSSYAAGGIMNDGSMMIANSTVSGNTALSSSGRIASTGGIENSFGKMMIANSTISGNTSLSSASAGGNTSVGGIENNYSGTLTIANSTVFENSTVPSAAAISGISLSSGVITLLFCTIANNKGIPGILVAPSIYSNESHQGSLMVKNTLVVATTIALDHQTRLSTVQSEGYNLVERTNATFFQQSGDSVIQDPSVVFEGGTSRLAKNGGPTQTIALRPNADNPAYNAIPINACHISEIQDAQSHTYIDQRGMPRPEQRGDQCSIGAYEAS